MWPVMVYGGCVFAALPRWACGWLAGPAVYMLCRRELDGRVTLLHIGETADLRDAIGAGDAWDAAAAQGLSEVHVHVLANGAAARRALAERLRRRYAVPPAGANPVHNDLARLADAFAPAHPPTIFDWLEAWFLAPEHLQAPSGTPRPAPVRAHGALRRAARGPR